MNSLNPANMKVAKALLVSLMLVLAYCFIARAAVAETPKPSKADLQNLEDIKANQEILEENREAHEAFMQAKSWNEAEVSELGKNGWRVDWATMKLVPLSLGASPQKATSASVSPSANLSETTAVLRKAAGRSAGYVWSGAEAYKNERLAYYQQLLSDRGITDPKDVKLLTANLIVENGALDENTNGDSGCSVGIPQRYVCQFGYSAKSFRKKYPEWNDWRFQLEWMADHTSQNYQKYDGDVFRTIVSHNSPAAAARGKDSCHISPCYYQRVKVAANSLTAL